MREEEEEIRQWRIQRGWWSMSDGKERRGTAALATETSLRVRMSKRTCTWQNERQERAWGVNWIEIIEMKKWWKHCFHECRITGISEKCGSEWSRWDDRYGWMGMCNWVKWMIVGVGKVLVGGRGVLWGVCSEEGREMFCSFVFVFVNYYHVLIPCFIFVSCSQPT